MRLRTNVIILIIAVSITAIVGFIGVTTGRSLKTQTADASKATAKICDPTDCRISQNLRPENCSCRYSVVLIALGEKGLQLTNVENGVDFDLDSEGRGRQRVSWTAANAADAFLFLDRNGSKSVDNAMELFGNSTSQSPSPLDLDRNGFLALAYYERANLGGNGDGIIDRADSLFSDLRLWRDVNHNGISEPGELHSLKESGIESISLTYKKLGTLDEWGNIIRYEADVYGENHKKIGTAYEVVLLPAL
jgi:hypothetical protein